MILKSVAKRALSRIGPAQAAMRQRRTRRGAAFYKQFLGPGDLCFDVGANVGERCEMFRRTGASVVAIEPQESAVETLEERFGDDPNVTIVPMGVGAEPGTATLAVSSADSTISTLSEAWRSEGRFAGSAEWDEREEIEITTLDALVERFGAPRFCKIDVEGYERQALEGLSVQLPMVSTEFTAEFLDDARRCLEVAQRVGPVEATFSLGEEMILSHPWQDPDSTLRTLAERPEPDLWGDLYIRPRAAAS